ncbi:hypothetical protein GPECTOR_1g832 [Gonium pectorale]|uniref:Uncharacterized protein n=1 Tax=Gonium pectorale TaxID=33097 RepID=A0A150H4D5_GONPE|nr:hypothetical protein GPECTOR_1g832 [Gonium pectorale]|eukprot:KXZ56923.1 hypothetical protein GPECTOR_1g832 [Gonium pectorale]
MLASPLALNASFERVPEQQHPEFWEIAAAAKKLSGVDAVTAQDIGDVVPQIRALSDLVSKLSDDLAWPVLRRIILAAVVQRRLIQGPYSAVAQAALVRLCVNLFLLHRRAAGRKGVIDFFHVSKAGGTTFCQLAKLNGCKTQSFAARRNCLIREFDDVPRWVNHSLHRSLAPEGLRTPWFANWGNKARNTVSCHIRKRFMLRRRFNVLANEFTVQGGARIPRTAHICPGHLNVLQLRHPYSRMRSHLMWVWALYDHHFKEQAKSFFPAHGHAHWRSLMPSVTHNYYIRSLLGEAVYYLPPENITADHLKAALLSLIQFDVLLLLEQPSLNELLFEMAVGWGLGFGSVHARTSSQVHEIGKRGLPDRPEWVELLKENQMDLELYRFGALLALLDSIMFDVAREAGLGTGYLSVQAAGAGRNATVGGARAVAPGDDEQWELPGNATQPTVCGYVSAHDMDAPLPSWLVV